VNYKIVSYRGGFTVERVVEPKLREVRVEAGVVSVTEKPVTQVIQGYRTDVLTADWRNGRWSTDENHGCQRCWGTRSSQWMVAVLKRCGFDQPTIRATLRKARGVK
jgi:hypothetical protein